MISIWLDVYEMLVRFFKRRGCQWAAGDELTLESIAEMNQVSTKERLMDGSCRCEETAASDEPSRGPIAP